LSGNGFRALAGYIFGGNESEKLGKLLSDKGIAYYGNFRFPGYNPPYEFIGRRNEVINI
jgi:hypothetical protein